ncbi:MAG TPA: sulfur carrier protein ThiS [Gammaproteobacteria bacterium]|nr:sulfur carrier protein ThiS [Gammaproteobacteria bacterium]
MGFIEIFVNGQARQVPKSCSVACLLDEMDLTGQRIAAEVNREIVPRCRYPLHTLHSGDRLEIVRAIGGG